MSCTLKKIVRDSSVYYDALKPIEQHHFIKGKIPFFSFYQSYDELSGDKWMTVYELEQKINGETVYYVRQYKIKRNEYPQGGSNCNPIFLPHLWNTKLDSVAQSTDFDKRGKLIVHSQEPNGSFTNIDLTSKDTFGTNEYDYNDKKHYIIHTDGRLSEGVNIPDSIVSKILNGTRLFITFKWSDVDEREVIDPNETFYGIYDFMSSDKTPMFKIYNVDGGIYIPNFEYKKDFEDQFPENEVTEEDKTEICQTMQQFMAHVKKSDKGGGGGGGADTIMIDDPDYLKKGGVRDKYTYIRNPQITKEQLNTDTLAEYNKLASSLMKTQTGLDKKTQNFCNSFITLINVFIDFLTLSTTELKTGSSKQNSMQNLFYHILGDLYPKIRAQNNIMLGGGKVTYVNPPKDNNPVEYPGNTKDERDVNKKNVIIVGGGPAGLYMSIVLKLMAPELEVHILEMRIVQNTNNRIMSRSANTLTVYTKLQNRTGTLPAKFKTHIENYDIDNSKFNLYTDNFYFLIPTQIKNPNPNPDPDPDDENSEDGINGIKLSANQLEYLLANYAQIIGVLIFHTTESYDKYVNENTIGIFDATGGRLKEQKHYQFRVDPNKQDIGDGLNINSLDFRDNKIPIVCIGESLFRGNYLLGLGMNTICTMCFYISFLFTLTMGVKEGYVETYKKFFEKDFPKEPITSAAASGSNTSSTGGGGQPVTVAVSIPGPTSTTVAVSIPSSTPDIVAVSIPGPTSTTVAVSTPGPTSTTVAVSTTPTTVAVPTSTTVAVPTSTTVAVSTPAVVAVSNSISKLQFIKVIFKGIIPEDVELVEQIPSSYTSKGRLQDYIKTQLSNVLPDFHHEEYFELTEDDKKLMTDIHIETMA